MAYDINKLSKLAALEALATRVAQDYATKSEMSALSGRVDELVTAGGEPNVLVGVKVNGVAQTIAEKMVDILIATGSTNGTIAVAGVDVAIKGLAALAFLNEVGYDELSAALQQTIDAKAAQTDVDGINTTLSTLIGEDTGKSVRTIANEELAKQLIPENASESLDTLTEIAAWIQAHPADAAAMNKAIADLTALVGTLPEGATSTTVVAYISEAIAASLASYYTKTEVDNKFTEFDTEVKAAIKEVDDKFANYYTSAQIDGMIATDEEVAEMLDSVFGTSAE